MMKRYRVINSKPSREYETNTHGLASSRVAIITNYIFVNVPAILPPLPVLLMLTKAVIVDLTFAKLIRDQVNSL